MRFLYVALGGMIGASLRYGAYLFTARFFDKPEQFLTTAAVNVVGSFILGCMFSLTQQLNLDQRIALLVMVGLLGSFTTFSTFAVEAVELADAGRVGVAIVYVLASNGLSFLAAWMGVVITRGISI